MESKDIKIVQKKILEIMIYVDKICRENNITYYIMGGTALGAVRHGGFIPWDDDLDIFMTPENYCKFKEIFVKKHYPNLILQEWKVTDKYLEYAKVRMNGTTFIEENFKDNKKMHHGIYIDIMILHKCPSSKIKQKFIYYISKYVTVVALSQRNWIAKKNIHKIILKILKITPSKLLTDFFYNIIYKYDKLKSNYKYCYFITKANFKQGIFEKEVFEVPKEIKFENTSLYGPTDIRRYLEIRFGDYTKMPSLEQQKEDIHAFIWDTEKDYKNYI